MRVGEGRRGSQLRKGGNVLQRGRRTLQQKKLEGGKMKAEDFRWKRLTKTRDPHEELRKKRGEMKTRKDVPGIDGGDRREALRFVQGKTCLN